MTTATERAVIWLAPAAPPCFASRSQWVSYVVSAAEAAREKQRAGGPLVYAGATAIAFNHDFNFCRDCDAAYAKSLKRFGECRPDYLLSLNPALTREKEVA